MRGSPLHSAGLLFGAFATTALVAVVVTIRPVTTDPGPGADSAGTRAALPIADPRLASETAERFRVFRAGDAGGTLTLRGPEISSLLQHAAPGLVPPGVLRPTVAIVDGRILVRARVVTASLPGSSRLANLVEGLRDTLDVEVSGRLVGAPGGLLSYRIDRVTAGRVRVPSTAVDGVLAAISGHAPQGALAIPWPERVGMVTVRDDHIVVQRYERILDREVDGFDGS